MFDHQIQNYFQKPLVILAKFLSKLVKPNQITILGFIFGIFMCIFIFFHYYFFALILLIINRLCDSLDGPMARLSSPTPLGGYLDIVSDFTIYSGFVLAFGLSDSNNIVVSILLLFLYIGTGTTFLAKAAIKTQIDSFDERYKFKTKIPKSFYYSSGLIEGTETSIYMVLCLLWPSFYIYLSVVFGILCLITFVSRVVVCYKEFI